MTFMMRPSVFMPTGTLIGSPVSVHSWPRVRPSDVSMAMHRTVFSPSCWATSRTRRAPLFLVSNAFRISGRWPSNCTSTTGPITWVILPTLLEPAPGSAVFAIVNLPFKLCVQVAEPQRASAPEMISMSSLVIMA